MKMPRHAARDKTEVASNKVSQVSRRGRLTMIPRDQVPEASIHLNFTKTVVRTHSQKAEGRRLSGRELVAEAHEVLGTY
jgi:hypothetical protein